MSDVTPFVFETDDLSVTVRGMLSQDAPVLIGTDVASALGYSNPSQAVATHVDPEDRTEATLQILEGSRIVSRQRTLINESGFYALVFGSKLGSAREFKRWVTSEVLPAIRRDGGYVRPDATPDQLAGIIARAEGQMRVLKLAEGLVDKRWLETKTRHVVARSLGEEPEVALEDRPLTTGEFLEEKGLSGAALRSTSPTFGKAVKAEYVAEHGREPGKADRFVDGTTRSVFAYTEAERPLFERAWSRMRPTIV